MIEYTVYRNPALPDIWQAVFQTGPTGLIPLLLIAAVLTAGSAGVWVARRFHLTTAVTGGVLGLVLGLLTVCGAAVFGHVMAGNPLAGAEASYVIRPSQQGQSHITEHDCLATEDRPDPCRLDPGHQQIGSTTELTEATELIEADADHRTWSP